MAENTNQTPTGSPNQGRWWEGYLVRYLVGSLVGAVSLIILAIEIKSGTPSKSGANTLAAYTDILNFFFDKDKGTTASIILFTGGGLYCYLASAPITVLHAGRMLKRTEIRKLASLFWVVTAILSFITITWTLGSRKENIDECTTWVLLVIALPFLWIMLAQWLTWLAMTTDKIQDNGAITYFDQIVECLCGIKNKNRTSDFIKHNRRLARFRTQSTSSKEIRETYSHLREHSNSIFIVVLEISLTAFLVFLHRLLGGNSSLHFWFTVLLGLLLWLTPNVLLWGQANRLEQDLADHPEEYPSTSQPESLGNDARH